MICAATQGFTDIVSLLMEDDRSNVNVKDCKGNTALHVAVLCQHVDIVRMMLQCPRFTEKKALNSRNLTAEMMAKAGSH